MNIDKTTYNKANRIPYNNTKACGYQPRPIGRLDIRSLIVHTTNGKAGSSLSSEATYISNSTDISSHYLIGKYGEIIEFLDPAHYIAYHAGCVKSTTFSNLFSIGIEMHNTVSEGTCTPLQLKALYILTKDLISRFDIKESNIETHRNVAVFCPGKKNAGKLGRKIDPSGFPDSMFYSWRSSLYIYEPLIEYRVIGNTVNIRNSPQINDNNIVGTLTYGDTFTSAALKVDEKGELIKGKNTWAHVTKGKHNGINIDGLGFVHTSNLTILGK